MGAMRYLSTVRIEKFGCVRDATINLSPIHAFIGPNGCGKSTVLRAIRSARAMMSCRVEQLPFESELKTSGGSTVSLRWQDGLRCDATHDAKNGPWLAYYAPGEEMPTHQQAPDMPQSRSAQLELVKTDDERWGLRVQGSDRVIVDRCAVPRVAPRMLRLDPDAIRAPAAPYLDDGEWLEFRDERGSGLPALIEALRSRDDGSFEAIKAAVKKRFPDIHGIATPNVNVDGPTHKGLGFILADQTRIQASLVSEGLLYLLALETARHVGDGDLLIIEEPENGLHPARLKTVVENLRHFADTNGVQVLMATHSPLLLNELRPSEVTVLSRKPGEGTTAKPLAETPHFQERAKIYELGELWVSYADGDLDNLETRDVAE